MMKKKRRKRSRIRSVLIFLGVYLLAIILSFVVSVLLENIGLNNNQSNLVAELTNGVIAAIAAGLVIFQLRENEAEYERQNSIEEAFFLMQLNQTFIQDPNMPEVEKLLEDQAFYGKKGQIITDANRQKFVNYLAYFDGFSLLVFGNVLTLKFIDDLMAYRFYLAVNNKEVQEKELLVFPGDYRGCFKLYKVWTDYRKANHLKIHLEENALDKWEYFQEYANVSLLESTTTRQLNLEFRLTKNQMIDLAELIYETDLDIHFKMFNSENGQPQENAKQVISFVLQSGADKLFNKNNLFVCTHEQEIVGLILWIEGDLNWDPMTFYENAIKTEIQLNKNNLKLLKESYFDKHYRVDKSVGDSLNDKKPISLINVCVKSEYRGRGIGQFMIKQFISNHPNAKMQLTIRKDNNVAMKLYKKNGFRITENYVWCSETNDKVKCCKMVRK